MSRLDLCTVSRPICTEYLTWVVIFKKSIGFLYFYINHWLTCKPKFWAEQGNALWAGYLALCSPIDSQTYPQFLWIVRKDQTLPPDWDIYLKCYFKFGFEFVAAQQEKTACLAGRFSVIDYFTRIPG